MSSTRRFEVGDKVETDHDGLGTIMAINKNTGVTHRAEVQLADGGVDWYAFAGLTKVAADPVFTDGREAFKPGDRVALRYGDKGEVVSVSTDRMNEYPVTVKNDLGAENQYRPRGLTKLPVEAPAPIPTTSKYEDLGAEIGRLVAEKEAAYGSSFAKTGAILRLMCPDGVKPEQYDNLLTTVRVLDKLFRAMTKPDAFGESPFSDVVGYGLLAVAKHNRGKK